MKTSGRIILRQERASLLKTVKETESKPDLIIRTERGKYLIKWEFTQLSFGKLPETIGEKPTGESNSDSAKG